MILFSSICISGIPSSIPDLHVIVLFYPGLFELGCMHIILHKWADKPRVLPARTSTRSVQLHASTLPFLPHTRLLHPPIDNNGDGGGEESPPDPPPHPGSASRCSSGGGSGGNRPRRCPEAPVLDYGGDEGVVPGQGRGRRPRRLGRQELPEGWARKGERDLSPHGVRLCGRPYGLLGSSIRICARGFT